MRLSPRGVPLFLVIAGLAALAPPAHADQKRLVTIAARSCPTYDSITANRARNNIMESLQDLGPDTPYGVGGVPLIVDPAIEARPPQDQCTAIENWEFTLGTGYQSRAVPGVWGALSKVTGPFSPTVVTKKQVPLRDSDGHPYPGDVHIFGAETIHLTKEQVELATTPSKLWIQGGTPTLPITDPETYSFGALRCATDNLNGDNVEWISYPPDTAHVFCFAYYVKPAPTSGTINVVKDVTLPPEALPQKVRFTGDISYANNEFFLTASNGNPGRISFIRAAGRTWSFREDPPPQGTLTTIDCTSQTGGSTFVTDLDTRETSVSLGAGDTVTCTYHNRYRRPPAGLALRKVSLGGLGTFGFEIEGEGDRVTGSATTTELGVARPVEPAEDIADLGAGTYRVTEDLPPDVGGTWRLERVNCSPGGETQPRATTVEITVPPPAGINPICTFTNRFTPAGRITLRKITLGATASTRFQVRPEFGETRPEREQIATTTQPGEPALATGDKLEEIPIGRYSIQETIGGLNRWEVAGVQCDGVPVPAIAGRIIIELTDANPAKDCTFINRRVSDVVPPDPEPPLPGPTGPPAETGPQGGIAGAEVASARANLVVTKRVRPGRVRLGGVLRYRIVVVNQGPDPAEDVTVFERIASVQRRLPVRTSSGTCRKVPPRSCSLGTLNPGERVVVRVDVRTMHVGRFVNRVAVNTATAQTSRAGKRAQAFARVVAPPRPLFTG
jgi:uncharacterized repeat protein (TIGR01451 family)